jgi:hypothetical protein
MNVDTETHQELAKAANGRVWELLEKARTPAETREMVHAAHASLWHWLYAGEAIHEQRGEWLVSRVYAVVRRPEPALFHARRCREITEANALTGFDLAYACEAMARAHAIAGDDDAAEWRTRAERAAETIDDEEDRAIFDADFAAEPWS